MGRPSQNNINGGNSAYAHKRGLLGRLPRIFPPMADYEFLRRGSALVFAYVCNDKRNVLFKPAKRNKHKKDF